jgi:hypothetical protein
MSLTIGCQLWLVHNYNKYSCKCCLQLKLVANIVIDLWFYFDVIILKIIKWNFLNLRGGDGNVDYLYSNDEICDHKIMAFI